MLHVNTTSRYENAHPWILSQLHRLPRRPDILLHAPGRRRNHRSVPSPVVRVPHFEGDTPHGLILLLRGAGEPCLDDIHPHLGQLAGYLELLGAHHGRPRGLLSIPEGCV
uniref:Uncharacterized protein n=1 Tax=Opuntia streptacantha TaxID=393608 RepID=A0A7C8ZI42_OPUST